MSMRPKAMTPEAFEIMPDGRQICNETPAGRIEYRARTLFMRKRQGDLCRWCGMWMHKDETTFDHDSRRNGRQDDRVAILKDGKMKWINAAVHALCNGARGSRIQFTREEADNAKRKDQQV